MSGRTILVWFRNDLRVHDNEILLEATRKADKVLPVYIFDPYYFKLTPNGTQKTGNTRAKFLIESVANLRADLRAIGGELLVRTGDPAELIPQLATEHNVNEVYHHREVASEETNISEQVETALWKIKLNLKHFIGHTLYNKEDLPFPIRDIPDSFAVFKKKVERDSEVRPCFPTPEQISLPENIIAGEIPSLEELGLPEPLTDERASYTFIGGETAGLAQLHHYFEQKDITGKNGRSTTGYASKISPWLAVGCLSPRQVYWEVFNHVSNTNQNNHPLVLELLWRDYFRFMFKKHGGKFYKPEGFKKEAPEVAADQDVAFENWKNAHTGVPFIDASMTELNTTGFISNYSRQSLAAYLIRELKVDWTRGAAYFEEKLLDYSPSSNWGNWAFVAGVGSDPKENRYFDLSKLNYDQAIHSAYIENWLSDIQHSA
ncbi:DASH family cryptochrome [Mucilaginibacter sp. RS28]|uniref:Cryptochrome DASH n=1 Tax=Mucilaginibacter straminoryzae TaxID=2932774 RepID=A0A9X2B992_9SPHI|nr:DASH family cryptochrome [Mucilaginibacter straminoryzae]MCJ8210374.1 DASH family cryptochrome [Mucilaginibacter straminoryzae]